MPLLSITFVDSSVGVTDGDVWGRSSLGVINVGDMHDGSIMACDPHGVVLCHNVRARLGKHKQPAVIVGQGVTSLLYLFYCTFWVW